jgi:hypothetical protein
MPVHRGSDSSGPFYQWGKSGKKYRYQAGDAKSRKRARSLAERQARAIRANGYQG